MPHLEYEPRGNTVDEHPKSYQVLFQTPVEQGMLKNIRNATNKSWVLEDTNFRSMLPNN
jgi:hypothetical protein